MLTKLIWCTAWLTKARSISSADREDSVKVYCFQRSVLTLKAAKSCLKG